MTEAAAAFKNRGDPARLQCFNYGAGEAPSVVRPRPRWQADLDALISIAHHSQTTSAAELPPAAASGGRWREAVSSLKFVESQSVEERWPFHLCKHLLDECSTLMICNSDKRCSNFSFPICEICRQNVYGIVFFQAEQNSWSASLLEEAAFSPRPFPLKSH